MFEPEIATGKFLDDILNMTGMPITRMFIKFKFPKFIWYWLFPIYDTFYGRYLPRGYRFETDAELRVRATKLI